MMTLYDMTTGQILETRKPTSDLTRSMAKQSGRMRAPQLAQHEFPDRSQDEGRLPPDLARCDIDAFLHLMR